MNGWRETTLGEVIKVKHGFAFKGEYFRELGTDVILTPGNFAPHGGLQLRGGKAKFYDGPFPAEYRLSAGDLLIALTDLKQDAPILGSPAVVPPKGSFLHNQRLGLVVTLSPGQLDPRFLFYLFAADSTRSQLRATATGTTVRHTAPERIYAVRIQLPPMDQQERIGRILGDIDDLVENNRRRIELLAQVAQMIYQKWFLRFQYPGREDDRLLDSPLGPIPAGWGVRSGGELFHVDKGVSYKGSFLSDEGRPMVGLKCFDAQGGFRFDGLKGYAGPVKERHLVRAGDVVMANTDLTQAGTIIGRVVAVPPVRNVDEVAVSHHVFALRPKDLPPVFLRYALGEARFRNYARGAASGTTVLGLRRDDVLAYPMIQPPRGLVLAFAEIASDVQALQVRLAEASRCLSLVRKLVLPRLMSGKVDVSTLSLSECVGEATG